jgi:hypothetical protein
VYYNFSCTPPNLEGAKFTRNGIWGYANRTGRTPLFQIYTAPFHTRQEIENALLWAVTPRSSYKNRRIGGRYRFHHQCDGNRRARKDISSNLQPKHSAKKYYATLMMEVIRSSETSVLTRAIRRNFPEDAILHRYCSKNLKSYIALTGWSLAET